MTTKHYQAPKTERVNFKNTDHFVCTQPSSAGHADAPRRPIKNI